MNTNKRSITLNLETSDGVDIFKRLVKGSDMVVETFKPGYLDSIGLGYSVLSVLNPGLILVSITGFGQNGPWKDYKAPDIVGLAVGGLMYVSGWPDRPPMRMGGSQAYHQASVQAAAGALIALYNKETTGKGQYVDVSMQQSLPISIQTRTLIYERAGVIGRRFGTKEARAIYGVFPCKDGFVDIRANWRNWDSIIEWMAGEGMEADLTEQRWQDVFYRERPELIEHINEVFCSFLKRHTKQEIYEEGQKRKLVVGSVNTAKEVAADPHLKARGFFVDLEHTELKSTLTYVGVPYRLSETPACISRRAPLIGEHNSEIYRDELGFSDEDLVRLKQMSVI